MLLALLATPAAAERDGVTFGVDAGPAWVDYRTGRTRSEVGVCPPALQLGTYVSEQVAVGVRATCSGITDSNDSGDDYRVWFYGLVIHPQYFPTPRLFVGASLGLGYQIVFGPAIDTRTAWGEAIGGRAGYNVARTAGGDVQISIEAQRTWFDPDEVVYERAFSIAVHVGWQSN